ncbi:MAG: zinc ribbon domain-containing protein [Planctomycetes bacterium]|nr:zinc ribbon domain-containing protein [Planctomycetota bacterium]
MPTYDYECSACRHTFEQFQSITAKPIRKCPACGKNAAKRLIGTGAGIIFRGSGFYQTDYRSDSYKAAAKADAERGSDGKTTAEAKTDGKATPEVKTEAKPARSAGNRAAGGNGSAKGD